MRGRDARRPRSLAKMTDQSFTRFLTSDSGDIDPIETAEWREALLSLVAAHDTWVEVRSGSAAGTILFAGTLGAGTRKTFTAPALWARFGAAADVAARLNGRTLQLPAGTYNALFTAAGFRQVSG